MYLDTLVDQSTKVNAEKLTVGALKHIQSTQTDTYSSFFHFQTAITSRKKSSKKLLLLAIHCISERYV